MNFLKKIYYEKYSKKSYSISNVDLIIDRIFRNQKYGCYVDIGCNHPIKYNNTYLLYKRGWTGINVDLDESSINDFNKLRPKDCNVKALISDKIKQKTVFVYHNRSAINTVSKELVKTRKNKPLQKIVMKSTTLNNLLENYKERLNSNIDLLSIDIENHEFEALKNFNFKKNKIKIVVIEHLNTKVKKLETQNQNLKDITKSKIYKLLLKNKFKLINWVNSDLIFANTSLKI